jgi:hypothetical protein
MGHLACLGKMRNVYTILVGKPEGKRPIVSLRGGWEGNIKTDLRRLVASLSPLRPGSVHVGFVVDKVALGQVFLQALWSSSVSIMPPWLYTHISSGG